MAQPYDEAPDPFDAVDDGDDEALRWEGDDDRGQIGGSRLATGGLASPEGDDLHDDGAGPRPDRVDEPAATPRPLRTLLTAVFALVFLVDTLGWILSVQRAGSNQTDLLPAVLDQFGMFTAIVAAPLWFGAAVTLTRESSTLARVGWLALGAGLLTPWPLILAVLATAGGAS